MVPQRKALVFVRRLASLAILSLLAVSTTALAAPGEGRLSRDLREARAAGQASFRVIVQGSDATVDALVQRYGGRVAKRLKTGSVIEVSGEALDAISADPGAGHLAGDTLVRSQMAMSTEAMGADQAWAGLLPGVAAATGRGIGVAVIDSGVSNSSALQGRMLASVDFTGPQGAGQDLYGHGTHVAGIIAGRGEGFSGVAPGANLVSLKVLGADGSGRTSDVIAAIDWAIDNRAQYGLRIINLSLGRPVFDSYRDDPLTQAVERAYRAGLVVVAAAGNYGKTADGQPVVGGVMSPCNSPYALCVGGLDTRGTASRSDDQVASWSSRGPTYLDMLVKPDLVAPGAGIHSLYAPGSYLARTYPERQTSGSGQSALFRLSGTSQASAGAAGAAAVVLEVNPGLTPAQVRMTLQITSSFMPDAGLVGAGAGA